MNQQQEQAIMSRLQQGEYEAFGEAYDALAGRLYSFIYYKVHHRQTAEDLLSQTFLKAVGALNRFRPERGRLTSWIYRIARNTVTDHYRTQRSVQDLDDAWDLGEAAEAEQAVDRNLKLEAVREHLQQLPVLERDIIILRVWQELSYAEIAAIVGKREGNCKVIYSRAIKRLKGSMPLAALLLLLWPGGPPLQ